MRATAASAERSSSTARSGSTPPVARAEESRTASGEAPPALPEDVVAQTRAKYVEAYERLTGETF